MSLGAWRGGWLVSARRSRRIGMRSRTLRERVAVRRRTRRGRIGMRSYTWCRRMGARRIAAASGGAVMGASAIGASVTGGGRRDENPCCENGSKSHENLLVHDCLPFRTFVLLTSKGVQ